MNNKILLLILLLSCSISAGTFNKSYALVIGIGDYTSKNWSRLPYAKKDAMDMAAYFGSQGYIVDSLFDTDATKAQIINNMQKLARKISPNDRVCIFFSGHGHTETYSNEDYGYLVPCDGTGTSATYISMEEFRGLAEKMKNARHQLFIIDACYSGLLQTKDIGLKAANPDLKKEPQYLEEAVKRSARQIILAGGKDQQVLAGGEGKNSHFTYYLLEALRNELADINGDGYITFSELCSYIVPRASNEYQTPAYGILPGHGLGEYIFTSSKTSQDVTITGKNNTARGIPVKGGGMVLIDSGSFTMGSVNGDDDEKPVHLVKVQSFYMDITEVTNRQYDECVNDGVCTPPGYNDGSAFVRSSGMWKKGVIPEEFRIPSHPVVAVTWKQADMYCKWKGGRLPSEEQWEYAARAGSPTDYFWGNDTGISCRYANIADSSVIDEFGSDIEKCKDAYRTTAPVGSYEPNWFGLYDMLGNVWEWCDGFYGPYVNDTSLSSRTEQCRYRTIRGGAWCDGKMQYRSSNRRWIDSENRNSSTGFRCVKDKE